MLVKFKQYITIVEMPYVVNMFVSNKNYSGIKFSTKFSYNNIGYNGKFYTFLYFLTFLLKKFLQEFTHK